MYLASYWTPHDLLQNSFVNWKYFSFFRTRSKRKASLTSSHFPESRTPNAEFLLDRLSNSKPISTSEREYLKNYQSSSRGRELNPTPAQAQVSAPEPTQKSVQEQVQLQGHNLRPEAEDQSSSKPNRIAVIEKTGPPVPKPVPSPFRSPRKSVPGDHDFVVVAAESDTFVVVDTMGAMGKQDPNHLKPARYQNGSTASTSLGAKPKSGINASPSPIPSRHRVSQSFISFQGECTTHQLLINLLMCYVMELFNSRWNPNQKYTTHTWHNSIVVWLLGQSSCSYPSSKELHG